MDAPAPIDSRLAVVQGILDTAFFTPLGKNDWLAYRFGLTAWLRLEDAEAFDLFVRAALTGEITEPEQAEGRTPLAWLWSLEDTHPVAAHVLASLRHDRPLLFHRTLMSLSAVTGQRVKPDDFELVEDFLAKALGESEAGIMAAAQGELEIIRARAMKAAGQDPDDPDPAVDQWATKVLSREEAALMATDAELRLWLSLGGGLEGVPEELAPAVMAEVWARWCGALLGASPDLELVARLSPELGLEALELAQFAPPREEDRHVLEAECPFCGQLTRVAVGPEVGTQTACPHLIYVGTGDEVHLLEVAGRFELGADMRELLATYYQSPQDLEMFATIVNDLFEMLVNQGRLATAPVACASAPQAFYNLMAFYQKQEAGDPAPAKGHTH